MSTSVIDTSTLGLSSSQISGLTTTSRSSMDSDDFLQLFLVQLQNQNPLDPMDTSEISSQTCQYSQLEQAALSNTYLSQLLQYQSSGTNSDAISLIGKNVCFDGDEVQVSDGDAGTMSFELESDAEDVEIVVYDESGEEMSRIELGSLSSGEHSAQWDGLDGDGNPVDDGTYTYSIEAVDATGNDVAATPYKSALVSEVKIEDGVPYLITESGESFLYSDVYKVTQA